MRRTVTVLVLITLIASLSEFKAQSQIAPRDKELAAAGFARTVSDLLTRMQGEWKIKSAKLMGADLPLDRFESLTVDEQGFTLRVQQREVRFAFAEFELEPKRLLAKSSSADYPEGLTYEVSLSEEVLKIRYRTDGAHVAPESGIEDHQLLVQTWTKAQPR